MHKERGIDSKAAKALSEQRRRSGGVAPSHFEESTAVREPIASTSQSTPVEETTDPITEPSSAEEPSRTTFNSLLQSPASPASTLPTEEVAELPRTPPRPSFDRRAPRSPNEEGQPWWKGKERAQHPVLVETCPTPPSTAKFRPGSRQRSIMHPSGLGIDVDNFQYGDEEDDEEETLENDEDPDEWNAYSRRPSATFFIPLHSPSSSSALPFPDLVESLLSRPSSTSSFPVASPPPSPQQYRVHHYQRDRQDVTPPLHHLRPLRDDRPPSRPHHQRELRAKASESSLYTWDLAHLPAPRTPREKPYRVGLKELLMPSFALGGGRGSGQFGDPYGAVERQVERPATPAPSSGGGLVRTISRRSARMRRSLGAWSLRSTKEEERHEPIEEGWTAVVLQ